MGVVEDKVAIEFCFKDSYSFSSGFGLSVLSLKDKCEDIFFFLHFKYVYTFLNSTGKHRVATL